MSRIKPSTNGRTKGRSSNGIEAFFVREGEAGATTTFDEELAAEEEKLGGAKEAKEGEMGLEALSKIISDDSTESGAPESAAGKSETVGSKRSSAWMVPLTNEDSAIFKKDGVFQ